MTEIEKKALAYACECAGRTIYHYDKMGDDLALKASITAHARAIEQHEAFKREVSDAVERYVASGAIDPCNIISRFILPKPVDPLTAAVGEAVWNDPDDEDAVACTESLIKALAARGLEVRKIEGEA